MQSSGEFKCSKCNVDTSLAVGCHGYVQCCAPGAEWEEKHLLNMIGDSSLAIRCLQCHFATIPCKFMSEAGA